MQSLPIAPIWSGEIGLAQGKMSLGDTMPRKPLTEDEKSVVRAKAAKAARRIIDEHGAEKITIRGIAKEVGMSAMSLYTYFENKADILAYLQVQAVGEMGTALAAVETSKKTEQTLAGLADAYITFAEEKGDEFRLAFRSDDGEVPRVARESLALALQPLRDVVSASAKDARSDEEVERIVCGIWSGWHGYALLKSAGVVSGPTPYFDLKTAAASFGARAAGRKTAGVEAAH